MSKLTINRHQRPINGEVWVPPSKYHLHRALIFGSLAEGKTWIKGKSGALHIKDTLNSLKDFGISIQTLEDGYIVNGGPYIPRNGKIRVGSSGSTLQFMLGLGSLSQGTVPVYDGHKALRERPIGPLLKALNSLGLTLEARADKLPVTVYQGFSNGGTVQIPGTLSQWVSGLLILAPFAKQDTIIEAIPPYNEMTYVQLTIQMMRQFGIVIEELPGGVSWRVPAGQTYRPTDLIIEPDVSSAAFMLVLGVLHPANMKLKGITKNGTHPENQILEIIEHMGIPLLYNNEAEISIHHAGIRPESNGLEIDMRTIPDLIPVLSVLAALAKGKTVLKNIGPGRMKESNRVKAMLQLNKMGAQVKEIGDDLIFHGVEKLHGASISTYNDHRVMMAFTLAGLVGDGNTDLTFPNAHRISYPEFPAHLAQLGIDIALGTNKPKIKEIVTV